MRATEGKRPGPLCLGGGAFAGHAVLFGLVCGGRVGHVALDPPHVALEAVVAARPAERARDVPRGGEVAGEPGEVGKARAVLRGGRPLPSTTNCMPWREASVRPSSRSASAR
ncbi:hypothetical protein ABT124_49105 [Streptomyces sp. NPDC001982]|uniref:hypothetical protein n=1 Tax=Streptomyces sp. NPDC001982 TaxID=3154405 RepID=UPI0033250ED4